MLLPPGEIVHNAAGQFVRGDLVGDDFRGSRQRLANDFPHALEYARKLSGCEAMYSSTDWKPILPMGSGTTTATRWGYYVTEIPRFWGSYGISNTGLQRAARKPVAAVMSMSAMSRPSFP